MTINELIQIAHADAKAKGWWDEERNLGELSYIRNAMTKLRDTSSLQ